MSLLDPIVSRLERVKWVKPDQVVACCPAHDDDTPSLALRDAGDKVLMRCYAGCTFDEIAAALGMQPREFFADSKAPKSTVPGVSRRQIYKELAVELLTAYTVTRDRAEGKDIAAGDAERERLARQRITKAWGALK